MRHIFVQLAILINIYIYIYYCWFALQRWISQSNIASEASSSIRDAMRNPFWTKHINNSVYQGSDKVTSVNYHKIVFIKALTRWHQWIITRIHIDNNSALTWHKIDIRIFPDSCRLRISNLMSSQCTVIVFILQSLVTLMDITTNIQII